MGPGMLQDSVSRSLGNVLRLALGRPQRAAGTGGARRRSPGLHDRGDLVSPPVQIVSIRPSTRIDRSDFPRVSARLDWKDSGRDARGGEH
eukprot:7111828-Pyramimonas_sp.AAC.1